MNPNVGKYLNIFPKLQSEFVRDGLGLDKNSPNSIYPEMSVTGSRRSSSVDMSRMRQPGWWLADDRLWWLWRLVSLVNNSLYLYRIISQNRKKLRNFILFLIFQGMRRYAGTTGWRWGLVLSLLHSEETRTTPW